MIGLAAVERQVAVKKQVVIEKQINASPSVLPGTTAWGLRARFITITVAAVIGIASWATQSHAASLPNALEELLASHPQILSSEKNREAQRAGIDVSRAVFFPKVSVNAGIGPEHVDNPTFRNAGKAWHDTATNVGVTVRQSLFSGFNNERALRLAELNHQLAGATLAGLTQNLLFDGIRAYVNILRQMRLVEMSRESERNIQLQLDLEDERVQRGSGIAVDVLQAKSRLQIAIEKRVTYEGALENAIATYQKLFDRAPDTANMEDPVVPANIIPSSIERVIEIALRENPILQDKNTNIEISLERKQKILGEYLPKLDLVGKANYESNKNSTAGIRRDYSVLMQASWDVFSGLSTSANMEKENFAYRASLDNFDDSVRTVNERAHLAWNSLKTVRERKALLENALGIAAEVYTARQQLREAGKETVINVLDAENEVTNAQISYISATYDELVAIYQLILSMGRLNADFLALNAN